ncbi:MAG: phosphoribosylformimino-5-aminoimidazole carboxamide ribotide isomerase [Lachnospiraceae bacterium]
MEFRPCIDIHNGKVKQIIGSSLTDQKDQAQENFVAEQDAAFYAKLYEGSGVRGGHIVLLNHIGSAFYEATLEQAKKALRAFPKGLQVGGGINLDNAEWFLDQGASHVIVTSYVFSNGYVDYNNLKRLSERIGSEKLVLDLSCRKKNDEYYVVTDRWQKFTDEKVTPQLLERLKKYADEFLIHAVDVEGKSSGIEKELVSILGNWAELPITYAGGVGSFADLDALWELGRGNLNVTIGSALDIFGGPMPYQEVISYMNTR